MARWYLSAITIFAAAVCGAKVAPAQLPANSAPIRDSQPIMQREVVSWVDLKKQYVVMQQYDYSCGASSLATLLRYYWGYDINERQVLKTIENKLTPAEMQDRIVKGLSLTDLKTAAEAMNFQAEIGRLELHELAESKIPVIAAIKTNGFDHFVVVRGIYEGQVYLADPLRGKLRVPVDTFEREWIGKAVLVAAPPGQTASDRSQLTVLRSEVEFPWLNRQHVRTHPEKTFLLR